MLQLFGNAIGDAGVVALSDAIAGGVLSMLEGLWLLANPIGEAGQAALAAAKSAIRGGGLGRLNQEALPLPPFGRAAGRLQGWLV